MKKIIILPIAAALLISGGVAATKMVPEYFMKTNEKYIELQENTNDQRLLIEDAISLKEDLNDDDVYGKLLVALEAISSCDAQFNEYIYNLEYLREAYSLTDDEMNYLYELIISGKDFEDIIGICYFWLDTNEDIEIIEEIYDVKWRYKHENWIEDAFNYVTDNKCGVLTPEDIQAYFSEGISPDDIYTANVLCRKGVLTIQEILKMRQEGSTFAEISAIVNETEVSALPDEALETVSEIQTFSLKNTPEEDEQKTVDVIPHQAVLSSNKLSRMQEKSLADCYQMAVDGEDITQYTKEYEEQIDETVEEKLRENNIYKPVSRQELEEYIQREAEQNEK